MTQDVEIKEQETPKENPYAEFGMPTPSTQKSQVKGDDKEPKKQQRGVAVRK